MVSAAGAVGAALVSVAVDCGVALATVGATGGFVGDVAGDAFDPACMVVAAVEAPLAWLVFVAFGDAAVGGRGRCSCSQRSEVAEHCTGVVPFERDSHV